MRCKQRECISHFALVAEMYSRSTFVADRRKCRYVRGLFAHWKQNAYCCCHYQATGKQLLLLMTQTHCASNPNNITWTQSSGGRGSNRTVVGTTQWNQMWKHPIFFVFCVHIIFMSYMGNQTLPPKKKSCRHVVCLSINWKPVQTEHKKAPCADGPLGDLK